MEYTLTESLGCKGGSISHTGLLYHRTDMIGDRLAAEVKLTGELRGRLADCDALEDAGVDGAELRVRQCG